MTGAQPLSMAQIDESERAYVARTGRAALGAAQGMLAERWHAGERDRETALRLAFMDWYSCAEPGFLTGLVDVLNAADAPRGTLFAEAVGWLLTNGADPEIAFVLGWMMKEFPWCCDSERDQDWTALGSQLWQRYVASGQRLPSAVFEGRGAYGQYFAHIASSH